MKKDKLLAIGEALIDFAPKQIGVPLKDVSEFKKVVGGAPANVCGAFSKLGGCSRMITQLGKDPFGDCIVEELEGYGIDTSLILRTAKANTALAFVSLKADGGRDFSFYRKPSADMLFEPEDIQEEWFEDAWALHFCSVDLIPSPMQMAHRRALDIGAQKGCLISFDPNVRLPLWEDHQQLRRIIREFMPKAHILKISDEELEFITGFNTVDQARDLLFTGCTEMVIFTRGSEGAQCYTKHHMAYVPSRKVKAVDTTGAGDGFIGSFLYQLFEAGIGKADLPNLTPDDMKKYLTYSNRFCAYSVMGTGAIASYPTKEALTESMEADQ